VRKPNFSKRLEKSKRFDNPWWSRDRHKATSLLSFAVRINCRIDSTIDPYGTQGVLTAPRPVGNCENVFTISAAVNFEIDFKSCTDATFTLISRESVNVYTFSQRYRVKK